MPRCARRRAGARVMSRPNSAIDPLSGTSSPVIRLKSVVLPAPLGPMISRRSPGSTTRSTLAVTRRPPNDLLSALTVSAVMGCAPRPAAAAHPLRRARTHCRAGAPQPHRARHQALRHEADDENENEAKDEVPTLDVGADHVLHDDDDGRAEDGPEQSGAAAGDHHQQRFRRGRQRADLRADELVVVEEQQARDAGPEAGEDDGQVADEPDVVAERRHAPRLVAGADEACPERRAHEDGHGDDGGQEYEQRRVVEGRRAAQAEPERRGPGRYVDAVVAVGEARPAVGDAPQDLPDGQGDHEKADAGGAQREHGEDLRHGNGQHDGGETGEKVAVPGRQHESGDVARHGEQPGMPQRGEAGVADQHVEGERQHGPQQDLAGDVDVVGVSDPERQAEQGDEHQGDAGATGRELPHVATLPNRPCGRSTRMSSIGRNRMT